jgi:hypothetical protein
MLGDISHVENVYIRTGYTVVLCQDLVQVKMRNFSLF